MRKINKIVLHCSDSPHELGGKMVGVQVIREWHLKRGWSDIGYHAVINHSGAIEPGRDEDTMGAHVKGHNKDSLGVCLVGKDAFTAAQLVSLKALLKQWMTKYHIAQNMVYGHYQLNANKTCPNCSIEDIRELMFRGG